ncbi:MAG: hypothetical protein K2N78_12365 [Oscillospiraceae bacterium]|nr:hypothetical protein [Oscillospiraceae bacterium]
MSTMSVQGVSGQQASQAGTEQASDQAAELLARLRQEDDDPDIVEMIRDAQKKAEAQRDALKVTKNTRYGDAPLEAYARLSRAKTKAQVNSASGYARQKIAQLKAAMRSDSDNAIRIKGSIRQL